jgi:hypothetical protein
MEPEPLLCSSMIEGLQTYDEGEGVMRKTLQRCATERDTKSTGTKKWIVPLPRLKWQMTFPLFLPRRNMTPKQRHGTDSKKSTVAASTSEGASVGSTPLPKNSENPPQYDRKLLVTTGPSLRLSHRRRQSRRVRNSWNKKNLAAGNRGMGYMQLRAAGISTHVLNTADKGENRVASAMLQSLKKKHLCDLELVGGDGESVFAPGYLLAIQSSVADRILYPEVLATLKEDASERMVEYCLPTLVTNKIHIPFATSSAISAAAHFLAAQSLPSNWDVRVICQLYLIGKLFKINSLEDEAYRNGRVMMNKVPHLACAVFDECRAAQRNGEEKDWWGFSFQGSNDLGAYSLECLLDAPANTLLRGRGTKFLSSDSIDDILCNKDMDTDELTCFHILKQWVNDAEGTQEEKILAAKSLVHHIDLSLISPDDLKFQVRSCSFVEAADVDKALREIELAESNRSPDELEHVIVEGAGDPNVNGMYVRMEEDIGLELDDVVFVKEAEEGADYMDYGLFLQQNKWSISSCTDYSNVLYSCEIGPDISSAERGVTPKLGWKTEKGAERPPVCHWCASKVKTTDRLKGDAPNIEDYKEQAYLKKSSTSAHDGEFPMRLVAVEIPTWNSS